MKLPFFNTATPAGKTLAGLTKPDRLLIALFVIASVASSGFDGVSIGMLVPLLGNMLDVDNYDSLPRLLKPIAGLLSGMPLENRMLYSVSFVVGAVILKNLCLAFSIYIGYWISERAVMRLRSQVSGILLSTDIDFFHRNKAGHLVDKVVTQTSHVGMLLKSFADLAVNVATFLILVALLVVFSWQLTLFTLVFAGLISLGVSVYIRTLSGMGEKKQEKLRKPLWHPARDHLGYTGDQILRQRGRPTRAAQNID